VLGLGNVSQADVRELMRGEPSPVLSMTDQSLRLAINKAAVLENGLSRDELARRYRIAAEEERKARAEAMQRAIDRMKRQRAS